MAAATTLLRPEEVARRYGVTAETVRRWMRKGVIAYVTVGPFHQKRIEPAEADKHFRRVDAGTGS